MSEAPKRSGHIAAVIGWIGPAVLAWGGLFVLSHRPGAEFVIWTNRLFGWTVAITCVGVLGWLTTMIRARRSAMLRWLALNVGLGVAWGVLELAAALNLVNWRVVFDRITGHGLVNYPYTTDFLLDPEFEFRRLPNAHWAGPAASDVEWEWAVPPVNPRQLAFHYDRWGYRNPTNLSHAVVALIGDSFVDGWYVQEEETAARILEAELHLPVANLGVAGYGAAQELLVLKKEASRLQPSVVVWFFFEGNDLYDDWRWEKSLGVNPARAPDKHAEVEAGSRVKVRQRSFAGNCLRVLRRWSDAAIPNRVPYVGFPPADVRDQTPIYFASYASVPWSEPLATRWGKTQAHLEEASRFCREHGISLLLCYVPIKFRVYQPCVELPVGSPCRDWTVWPLPKHFADFCRASAIPFLDLTEPLESAVKAGRMPYARTDSHWGPEGHRLVASILCDELHRRGWLPASQ